LNNKIGLTSDDFMAEACRLAKESVDNARRGPFGAVLVKHGDIIARGQNRVLLTGTCPVSRENAYGLRDVHQRRAVPNVHERDLLATYRRGLFRQWPRGDQQNRLRRRVQYEDFTKAYPARRIKIEQFRPDLAETAYRAWEIRANKHPY
jgi:guanine deaminase